MKFYFFYLKRFLFIFLITILSINYAYSSDAGDKYASLKGIKDKILSSSYKILDYYEGESELNVINIQDFHCHFETQKKHSMLLAKLLEDSSINLSFIGIEGTTGIVDTSFASATPDKKVRKTIADEFLKSGFISGIEYYIINTENPVFLYGIDNPELYKKNTEIFLRLQNDLKDEQAKAKEILNYLFGLLADMLGKSSDLELPVTAYLKYLKQEITLAEFADRLFGFATKEKMDLRKYPQISLAGEIIKTNIDTDKLDSEKNILFNILRKNIPANFYNELKTNDMQASIGNISNEEFYRKLFSIASKHKVDLSKFDQLSKYRNLVQTQDRVRESELNIEVFSLFFEIENGIEKNPAVIESLRCAQMITVMTHMLNLSASRTEYDYYLKNREYLSTDTIISTIINLYGDSFTFTPAQEDKTNIESLLNLSKGFYDEALKRDSLMADSALITTKYFGGKTIILFTGGFHSDGIGRIFKEKGINFISVVPTLSGKSFQSTYKNEMMNFTAQLDSFLLQSINKLMPSSNFRNIFYPNKEFLLTAKWFIFANVLSSLQSLLTEPLPPQALQKMVRNRQNEWIENLQQAIEKKLKKQIEQGFLSPAYIKEQVEKFSAAIEKIELDFDNYIYFNKTMAVPVIVKGKTPAKFIISINPESDISIDYESFIETVEKYKMSDSTIRILPFEAFESIISAEKIGDQVKTTEDKQKLIALIELFGKDLLNKLFEKKDDADIRNILDEMPSYSALKDMVTIVGIDNASELMLWDHEGFFNLCYIASQMEDNTFMFDYATILLNQRGQRNNKEGLIPDFIIEEASLSDISVWFSYGLTRTFDYDHWVEVTSTNDYFYKSVNPDGKIVGMVSARPLPEKQIMVIDLIETSHTERLIGTGKALVKAIARESIGLGFGGRIALIPESGSEEFYMNLGFSVDPTNTKYFILYEEDAKKLLGLMDADGKTPRFSIDQEKLDKYLNLPFVEALENFTKLIHKFEQLGDDDKTLIVSQLMKVNGLTREQARGSLRKMLVDPDVFTESMTELYDKMVDSWLSAQNAEQSNPDNQDYDVVRPVMGNIPDFIPTTGSNELPEIRDYISILTQISELRFMHGDYFSSAFNKTLAEKPSSISLAKRELQQHGFYIDIEILPSSDPRIQGKLATTIDNRVYMNENATRADFWFYLPHEVAHFLKDEKTARVYDAENIRMLKEMAAALNSVKPIAGQEQRKDFLSVIGSQIMYTALLYELDIITARLQLTPRGSDFLEKHNLPRFEGVNKEYLSAIAKSSSGIIHAFPQIELIQKLKSLASDTNLSDTQYRSKIESLVVRGIIQLSLSRIKSAPDQIDKRLSDWISQQMNRRFWQIGKSKIPNSIKPYIRKSEAELGYIDIRFLQNQICHTLRVTDDSAKKTVLEREVVKWMITLIRENIKPESQISEIPDIFTRNTANCLGYTKLFDMITSLFGINVQKTLLEYEYQGRVELHAVNIVKYSNGTCELADVAVIPKEAVLKSVLVKTSDGSQKFISSDEFNKLDPSSYEGVGQRSIDAYTYSTRATTSYFNGKINDAFNYMTVAFKLDPKNIYMAFNMAEMAYYHWKKSAEDMGINPSESDSHRKMIELFNKFELYRIGSNAWNYFTKEIKSGEHALVQVGITNSVGNNGGYINPYYDLRLRELQQSKQIEQQPVQPNVDKTVDAQKSQPEPSAQETSPNRIQDALSILQHDNMLQRLKIEHAMTQAQPRTARETAVDQYRVNELVTNGLEFNSARKLIQIGHQIESVIRQQQFQQVQGMFMGLDPRFAERIMLQFPYIMAFMAELYPQWWKGTDLNELAKKANLSNEIREMVRKQLSTVNAIERTQDRDLLRNPHKQNPLVDIMAKDKLARSLERMQATGSITDEQYRSFYEVLAGNLDINPNSMSEIHKHNLFGKRDEIPVESGIRIKEGFVLGGLFQFVPDLKDIDLYRNYFENLINEHPQELANAIVNYADPLFIYSLNEKLNLPVADLLARSRGALPVIAQDTFSAVSEQDMYRCIRYNIDTKEKDVIVALFTSNLARGLLSDFINNIFSLGMLDQSERRTIEYLKKYYVDGDENTQQFKQAVSLMSMLVKDNPILREKVIDIAVKLKSEDPGKLFYAFLSITLSYPDQYTDLAQSIMKNGNTDFKQTKQIGTAREYIDSAM